jgi:hypothetical protein
MYYREEIINGVLCFKTTPSGEWIQIDAARLTARLVKEQNTRGLLVRALENMVTAFNCRREDIDPLAAMATIEQAKHAISNATGVR